MIRFISFIVKEKDKEFLNVNCLGTPAMAAYYHIGKKLFYWQHVCQVGNDCEGAELIIKSLDDLDKVLFLISLGLDTKELQEMIDGDCLDTL